MFLFHQHLLVASYGTRNTSFCSRESESEAGEEEEEGEVVGAEGEEAPQNVYVAVSDADEQSHRVRPSFESCEAIPARLEQLDQG